MADCLKESSLLYTIVAAGLGDGYSSVKYPFGHVSNIRPIVTLLYLIIAVMFLWQLWSDENQLCLVWLLWLL